MYLNDNPDVERKNIETFREELKDLGTENPTIIALGNDAYKILTRNLEDTFTIVKVTHYSAYINPQKYREEFEICNTDYGIEFLKEVFDTIISNDNVPF